MITTRTAKQCGQADFGWLQARYTFSFGHYFDPKLLGYASLRVLNQEVLAPARPSSRVRTRKSIS
jgi:redox-sensitive bicupin YhaK (pirin superfamily)